MSKSDFFWMWGAVTILLLSITISFLLMKDIVFEMFRSFFYDIRFKRERANIIKSYETKFDFHRNECYKILSQLNRKIAVTQSIEKLSKLYQVKDIIEDVIFFLEKVKCMKTEPEIIKANEEFVQLYAESMNTLKSEG